MEKTLQGPTTCTLEQSAASKKILPSLLALKPLTYFKQQEALFILPLAHDECVIKTVGPRQEAVRSKRLHLDGTPRFLGRRAVLGLK